MLPSTRHVLVAVAAPLALLAGCTFASPTTSTYNAGKAAADAGAAGDGGVALTSSSSGTAGFAGAGTGGTTATASTATTTDGSSASGGATCCALPSGGSEGTCIPAAAVPTGEAGFVEQNTCATDNVCVPTSQVTGTPTKCGLVDGLFAGVCIGTCFSTYLSLASVVLTSSECDPDDACVPCEALQGSGIAGCD